MKDSKGKSLAERNKEISDNYKIQRNFWISIALVCFLAFLLK